MQHPPRVADFIIGGCLFLCALAVFFFAANKLRREPDDVLPPLAQQPEVRSVSAAPYLAAGLAVALPPPCSAFPPCPATMPRLDQPIPSQLYRNRSVITRSLAPG